MKHIRPHRWADLSAGRLTQAEGERMERHAASCARCAGDRDRVTAAGGSLRLLGASSAPSIPWDRVGAQLYWSASKEMRARKATRRRVWPLALAGAALGAAAVAVLAFRLGPTRTGPPVPLVAAGVPEASIPPPPMPPASTPAPLEGVVTLLQGDARVDDTALSADFALRAGQTLRTGAGRLGVQIGPRTGFVLEPHSSLELLSLDGGKVLLRLGSGAVGVEVEGRRPGQRFAVLAGSRTVEVRGTIFRVAEQAGDVDVAVRRGKVSVIEGLHSVEVAAGARLALARGAAIDGLLPEPMAVAAADALAEGMRVPLVPDFTDATTLRASSPMLSVTAPPRNRVRVDGVEAGTGSFQIRRAPGRHIVESGSVARWVEVDAGAPAVAVVTERARSERPGQLDAQLRSHRAALARCAQRDEQPPPGAGGGIEVEIGILGDGSVDFVAPAAASASSGVQDCVLDLIRDRFTFPVGSAATVRREIRF